MLFYFNFFLVGKFCDTLHLTGAREGVMSGSEGSQAESVCPT